MIMPESEGKKSHYSSVAFAVIFLVFLIGTIWIVALEDSRPYLLSLVPQPNVLPYHRDKNDSPMEDEDGAGTIIGTHVQGTNGVDRFRTHLQCFSESGKWVYDPTPRHLPWNYVGDRTTSKCEYRHLASGADHVSGDQAEDIVMTGPPESWLVREELKWVWQTNSSCPWHSINREKFCKLMGPKMHVMVVGDSINHEVSWALMHSLIANASGYTHLNGKDRTVPRPFEMCEDVLGTGMGFTVSFVRNDRLSPIVNATEDSVHNFYEFPWVDLLQEYDIRLLFLNRGAHFEDDEIYTAALRDIFTILTARYPNIQVIYRNTQPGHLNCMNFTKPLSEPQQELPWHWGNFQRQNLLAKPIVEEFGYIYMDVYAMLSLRPDGHVTERDCLHYCLPGPIDVVSEYLYNILLLL